MHPFLRTALAPWLALGLLACAAAADSDVTTLIASGASQVATGSGHSCALVQGGAVQCWGGNDYYQLGDGSTTPRAQPAAVLGLPPAAAISTSSDHSCAITTQGEVWCWGANVQAQLDSSRAPHTTPLRITGLAGPAVAISAGVAHSCVVIQGGALQCWGDNSSGQLATGNTDEQMQPTTVRGLPPVAQVAAAQGHTCALTTNGAAYCWGFNNYGQVGGGSQTKRLVPTPVAGLTKSKGGITQLRAAPGHNCALLPSGAVQCWGYNYYGQLGDASLTERHQPTTIAGLDAQALATGDEHSCAINRAGGALCWGNNSSGQLGSPAVSGPGGSSARNTPTPVTGLASGLRQISAGSWTTCALTTAGAVQCWGKAE